MYILTAEQVLPVEADERVRAFAEELSRELGSTVVYVPKPMKLEAQEATLLDQFAMAALTGLLSKKGYPGERDDAAIDAYSYAGEMMREREIA